MAEDSAELEGLEAQLQRLLGRDPQPGDSQRFCFDFCTLVEQHASHWQLPLPQLRILQVALCYFTRASTGFASNCDHVLNTLSSLALSIFELLLFFDQKDFDEEPLKQFSKTFQTCHLVLSKQQNVHLLQVERLIWGGGPWASPALQAILSESSLPQNEVDECIGSELPVFFELRVHYLLSCRRVAEAMALARCCARHPAAGQHLFFLQVYLTWLCKTSQYDRLHQEVAIFNGKDAVHIICSLENDEEDELLLALCTVFLSEQLRRGDLYCLCDLVFVWTKLHSRLNSSKQALLQESRRMMLSATNVNSIFPFIRAILQEAGEAGVQFCVEVCANALQSRLPCDVTTKTLIYKTIAGLLPNDLEVCRACALLIFFLERTVESYKMVYLLYMHPDQEYHVDCCPIGNHIRFETLQILKKDLCFDPEFWNLIALRTNCLNLMREKVVSAALEEIMEDKWISNYCTKDSAFRSAASVCKRERRRAFHAAEKKRHRQDNAGDASKRLKIEYVRKKKGYQGSRPLKETSSEPLRRSFWQLERLRDNGEHRRTTRLSEKNPQKRRIRKPRWLLEDSGTLEENSIPLKVKRHGLKDQKHHRSSMINRSECIPFKNNAKHKPPVNFEVTSKENGIKHHKEFSLDGLKPTPAPQVVLELSLPDNELLGTFTEDASSRQRGLPQVLLYKPTVKLLEASQTTKPTHGKEVILRARDVAMLVQQLHCYTRKQRGKGINLNAHGSVSTITRSCVQGSPPKDSPRELSRRLETAAGATEEEPLHQPAARAVLRKLTSAREISEKSAVLNTDCEEPAVEMKVTIASQSPVIDKVGKGGEDEVSQTSAGGRSPPVSVKVSTTADVAPTQSEKVAPEGGNRDQTPVSPQPEGAVHMSEITFSQESKDTSDPSAAHNDLSAFTLVTEMVGELSPERLAANLENDKRQYSGNCSTSESKNLHKMPSTSNCLVPECEEGRTQNVGPYIPGGDDSDDSEPETEESKLEYCCTFCSKDFKGRRVVEHAMFHYRRDECMFCGMTFKDDLLAMMHLSDHIEKLKRLKEPPGNKVKAKRPSDTKDTSTAKTSSKVEPKNVSSGCAKRGRPRKSAVCSKPHSPPDDTGSKSRTLRSNNKASDEIQLGSKPTVHKLNGHKVRRKELKRLRNNLKAKISQEIKSDTTTTNHKLQKHKDVSPSAATLPHRKSSEGQAKTSTYPEVLKTSTKQDQKEVGDEKRTPEAKVFCPVDGCSWRKDLSKNRVALLYHALEDHCGEIKPLELAFSLGNGKCSICMRVLWSFEHYQHHVERHRLSPRHPCLHQGCTARFKTGIEMRRHTRKHSPLQAACCLPGCSRLFICLWALNLHEREHYAQQSSDTNIQNADGHSDTPAGKKPSKSKDAERAKSRRTRRKRRKQPQEEPQKEKPAARGSKENEGKNPNMFENFSNKNTTTKPSAPYLRLRLRGGSSTPAKVHKAISDFLIKRSRKVRHKLKKKQTSVDGKVPKRRGRPPKIKTHESTTGHKDTIRETMVACSDQKQPAQSPPNSAACDKKEETRKKIPVKPAEAAADESKLRQSVKRSHCEEKVQSPSGFQRSVTNPEHKTPKLNAAGKKKFHTKSHKGTTRMVTKKHHISSALKKRAKTVSTVPQPESKASEAGDEGSSGVKQTEPGNAEIPIPPTATENPESLQSEEKINTPQNRNEQTPVTIERPQNLESEEKTMKTENTKEKTNITTQKHQRLQSKEKSKKQHNRKEKKSPDTNENKKLDRKSVKEKRPCKTSVPPQQTSVTSKCEEKRQGGDDGGAAVLSPPSEGGASGDSLEKSPKSVKKLDPSKAKRKSKVTSEDLRTDANDGSPASALEHPAEPENPPQLLQEVKPEVESSSAATRPPRTSVVKRPEPNEGSFSVCNETLKQYSQKPYLRLPPTVYLDEKFTTMPKRRKEMSFSGAPPKTSPPEPTGSPLPLQRQRCANCFTTFHCPQELQRHLTLKTCSTFFGFDSDNDD